MKQTEIAKMFGVSVNIVNRIKLRKTWRHIVDITIMEDC